MPTALRTKKKRAPLTKAIKDAAMQAAAAVTVAEVKRRAASPIVVSTVCGIGIGLTVYALMSRGEDD